MREYMEILLLLRRRYVEPAEPAHRWLCLFLDIDDFITLAYFVDLIVEKESVVHGTF